jgi:hypothetical protein
MRRRSQAPKARPYQDFIVETLDDEVLVYDQLAHQAHCLSRAAAAVWQACDGRRERAALEQVLREAGSQDDVDAVLAHLERARLLVARPKATVDTRRRAFVSQAAVAAGVVVASPVVFSIVAPSVAEAASVCGFKGQPCCQPGNKCKASLKCNAVKVCN